MSSNALVAVVGVVIIIGLLTVVSNSDLTGYLSFASDEPVANSNSCSDSDGGNERFTQGRMNGSSSGRLFDATDRCSNASTLREYYCREDGRPGVVSITCPCSNGACVQEELETVPGAEETGDTGGGSQETEPAPSPITCTDSDGANYTNRGAITVGTTEIPDACEDENHLREFLCSDTGPRGLIVTCRCVNGACISESTGSQPYQLVFENVNVSLALPEGEVEYHAIAMRALTGSIRLDIGPWHIDTREAFLLTATLVGQRQHIGKIAYQNETGWQLFELERVNSDNSWAYSTSYSNGPLDTEIHYVPQRATLPTPQQQIIIIDGRNSQQRQGLYHEWSGNIQLIDSYNSETGQGGTWRVSFNNVNGLGNAPNNMGEAFRSITYNYYDASNGPLYANYQGFPSWSTQERFENYVRNGFNSPSGTFITSLTRNRLELRQTVTSMVPGTNYVERFEFQCIDPDPGQDIYRPGVIAMRHVNRIYYPYYPNPMRDRCYYSGIQNASVVQYACQNEIPRGAEFQNCPNVACNVARTACAPANTQFTCEEVVDYVNSSGTMSPGRVIVWRAPSVGFESVNPASRCVGNALLTEVYCNGNNPASRQVSCPNGCNYATNQCNPSGPVPASNATNTTNATHDVLEISEFNLTGNLPGGQGAGQLNIHAISFCSARNDAFRFGADNARCVYLLAKNRTVASRNLTGSWYYYDHPSGTWRNATNARQMSNMTNNSMTSVSPPYYYVTNADSNVRFNVLFIGGASWISGGGVWTYNGAHRYLEIVILDTPAGTELRDNNWRVIYDYGTSQATNGSFSSPIGVGSGSYNRIYYGYDGALLQRFIPYTSPRGSHVDTGGFNADGLTIRYAQQIHSD